MITLERLKSQLLYDPETGVFTWKVRKRGLKSQLGTAGCKKKAALAFYIEIRIDGHLSYAHRLAWFYVTGKWPTHGIDHRDGDGLNNRFKNLREATQAQNTLNRAAPGGKRRGVVPFKGVFIDRRSGRYYAQIGFQGKTHNLGTFHTAEEARDAYLAAAARLHGEFVRAES